jgi:hypothetical protein
MLGIMNSAKVNRMCRCLYCMLTLVPSSIYPAVVWLHHTGVLFLVFWGTATLDKFTFPLTVYRVPFSPVPLHQFVIVGFLDVSHPGIRVLFVFFFLVYLFFIYSHVHTLFGSFLPPISHPHPPSPTPLASRQNLFYS